MLLLLALACAGDPKVSGDDTAPPTGDDTAALGATSTACG